MGHPHLWKPGLGVWCFKTRVLNPFSGPDSVPRALGDSRGKLRPVGGGTKTSGRQKTSGCQTDELGKEPRNGLGLHHGEG